MRRLLFITSLIIYSALLVYFSLARIEAPDPGLSQIDKIYHGAAYTLLALLLLYSFKRESGLLKVFFIATGFGLLMEFFQYFIDYRDASFFDAAANALGAAAGTYGGAWVRERFGG